MADRLSWEIVASLWLHLSVGATLVLFERCAPTDREPLFKPHEVMTVQIASAPKPKAARTQRAERAPTPPPAAEPAPEPSNTPPPAATSDMVLEQDQDEPDPVEDPPEPEPEPDPPQGDPEPRDNSADRAALLDQTRDDQVNPDAPLGTENRAEAGPDGVEGATASVIGIGEADPVLAAYIQACREAILPNWTPLPSLVSSHPEYYVIVQANVAPDGRLSSPEIVTGSGDAGFDRTAVMALLKTQRVPPPPAEWQASAQKGVQFRLAAKDK